MNERHLSSEFDADLRRVSSLMLEMGGLVENQVARAMHALVHLSGETATQVLSEEARVNRMEVELDATMQQVIAIRQPAAIDLRLLIAVSKASSNLERVGDEAARIARTAHRLLNTGLSTRMRLPMADLDFACRMAREQLRKALDAFARLDAAASMEVLRQDDAIDREFDGLLRKLITYMMEDPRTVSSSIDMVFVAKAIERIGDHAKNIAETVIYIVKGTDVRHTPLPEVEKAVG